MAKIMKNCGRCLSKLAVVFLADRRKPPSRRSYSALTRLSSQKQPQQRTLRAVGEQLLQSLKLWHLGSVHILLEVVSHREDQSYHKSVAHGQLRILLVTIVISEVLLHTTPQPPLCTVGQLCRNSDLAATRRDVSHGRSEVFYPCLITLRGRYGKRKSQEVTSLSR